MEKQAKIKWGTNLNCTLSISPDNKHFVIGCGDMQEFYPGATWPEEYVVVRKDNWGTSIRSKKNELSILDLTTGNTIKSLKGHSDVILSTVWSKNGKYLFSASCDQTIKMWEVSTGKTIKTFYGHSDYVNSLKISNDNKYLYSASNDRTVKKWDIETGKTILTLRKHSGNINCLSISEDDKLLVSGGDDKTIIVWDTETGNVIKELNGHEYDICFLYLNPDQTKIISGGKKYSNQLNELLLWDISNKKIIYKFNISEDDDYNFCLADDEDQVVYVNSGQHIANSKYPYKMNLWSY